MRGESAPKPQPSDVSMDIPAYLPDDYIESQEAKLDVYKRLARYETPHEIEALRGELRDRFGALPPQAEAMLSMALLRVVGGTLGIEGILVRGEEARITFRDSAIPRMKGLSAAFHEVQFQAEVRRAHPLSLKLTRLGGAPLLDGLVRALRAVA
jgi:transcription-repair coupling factor (superfamily II helicase)